MLEVHASVDFKCWWTHFLGNACSIWTWSLIAPKHLKETSKLRHPGWRGALFSLWTVSEWVSCSIFLTRSRAACELQKLATHSQLSREFGFDVKLQFGLKADILHAILNKTSHKAPKQEERGRRGGGGTQFEKTEQSHRCQTNPKQKLTSQDTAWWAYCFYNRMHRPGELHHHRAQNCFGKKWFVYLINRTS